MYAYQFNKKIYCGNCYMEIVPKDERKSGHVMDGNRFYEKFEDRVVECADCGYPLHYRDLYTTTAHSLGEHDEEED